MHSMQKITNGPTISKRCTPVREWTRVSVSESPCASMPPRLPGAIVRLCLLFYAPALASADYTCTSLGFECLNRIYVGSYSTEALAKAACDANSACVAYDYSAVGSIGFQCSTTTTRVDGYNEYKM